METSIKWNVGDGDIKVSFTGEGDGDILITSSPNEGIDREQELTVQTLNKVKSVPVLVRQEGLREVFNSLEGEFLLSDGSTFNVLKH